MSLIEIQHTVVFRSSIILKNKYANLKKRLIKKIGNEKAGVSGTGDGPYREQEYNGSDRKFFRRTRRRYF